MTSEQRFALGRISYNYCGVCGHVPRGTEEPNRAPLRWLDLDNGWKIGTLCRHCAADCMDVKPKPADFAFKQTNEHG